MPPPKGDSFLVGWTFILRSAGLAMPGLAVACLPSGRTEAFLPPHPPLPAPARRAPGFIAHRGIAGRIVDVDARCGDREMLRSLPEVASGHPIDVAGVPSGR